MRAPALTTILISLVLPHHVSGQDPTSLLSYDLGTCQATAEAVRDGASLPDRTQALWYLRLCGPDGASALASEVTRLRTTADLAVVQSAYHAIASVVDSGILDSALRLAVDRGATQESRVMAVRLLLSYRTDDTVSPSFSSFSPGNQVELVANSPATRVEHAPLPRAWESRVGDLLAGIVADSTDGQMIRSAARWALSYF